MSENKTKQRAGIESNKDMIRRVASKENIRKLDSLDMYLLDAYYISPDVTILPVTFLRKNYYHWGRSFFSPLIPFSNFTSRQIISRLLSRYRIKTDITNEFVVFPNPSEYTVAFEKYIGVPRQDASCHSAILFVRDMLAKHEYLQHQPIYSIKDKDPNANHTLKSIDGWIECILQIIGKKDLCNQKNVYGTHEETIDKFEAATGIKINNTKTIKDTDMTTDNTQASTIEININGQPFIPASKLAETTAAYEERIKVLRDGVTEAQAKLRKDRLELLNACVRTEAQLEAANNKNDALRTELTAAKSLLAESEKSLKSLGFEASESYTKANIMERDFGCAKMLLQDANAKNKTLQAELDEAKSLLANATAIKQRDIKVKVRRISRVNAIAGQWLEIVCDFKELDIAPGQMITITRG